MRFPLALTACMLSFSLLVAAAKQEQCSKPSTCPTGYCDRGLCGLLSAGDKCSSSSQCLSKTCTDGSCAKGQADAVCRTDNDCAYFRCKFLKSNGLSTCVYQGQAGDGDLVPRHPGEKCYGDNDCVSRKCHFKPASAEYTANGPAGQCGSSGLLGPCFNGLDCTSHTCGSGSKCIHAPPGEQCTVAEARLCTSGVCETTTQGATNGTCGLSRANTKCRGLMDCVQGYACLHKTCQPSTKQNGESCSHLADCVSLNCSDGVCAAKGDGGADCEHDFQCLSGKCDTSYSTGCYYPER